MTLNELRYIVAVARERHFGRAAESCFVSQPTLSVAVKKLEDELGVNLFERGAGEVTITSVGEQIVNQAQRVLEETETIKQLARHGTNQLAGPLRVGAIYTIGPYLFPHLIPVMAERAPEMPLLIDENFTAVLSERLKRGELDVIVVSLPFAEPGIVASALYDEPFVLLVPTAHPWVQRDRISAQALGKESVLLLGPGHCFRDQVLQVCPQCLQRSAGEASLQRSLEGGSLETIRYMVASGVGVTVLPCTAACAERFSERLVAVRRFAEQPPQRRVALAWRKSFPRPQAIDLLKGAIRACHLSCVEFLDGVPEWPTRK
jgi:LysR family hydrogen peroxide-inducible transcriptional activator